MKTPVISAMKSVTTRRKPVPSVSSFSMIENMSLSVLLGIFALVLFLYNMYITRTLHNTANSDPKIIVVSATPPSVQGSVITLGGLSTRSLPTNDILNDPYVPPLKRDDYFLGPSYTNDIRGLPMIIEEPVVKRIPINVETRGIASDYTQIGILTKIGSSDKDEYSTLILPLMGRRSMTGRDKWQYYSISNTGVVNTKLPVKYQGKSCTSEYGCDAIMDGDELFVEGYKHKFRATIYENNRFNYIPVL